MNWGGRRKMYLKACQLQTSATVTSRNSSSVSHAITWLGDSLYCQRVRRWPPAPLPGWNTWGSSSGQRGGDCWPALGCLSSDVDAPSEWYTPQEKHDQSGLKKVTAQSCGVMGIEIVKFLPMLDSVSNLNFKCSSSICVKMIKGSCFKISFKF